jgi:hypothetical protein
MPYTAEKPARRETNEQLRGRIPGWGADLDPANRPSVPRERFAPDETGAHWHMPERQGDPPDRERSIEHLMLTPVYGTTQPLRGLSGAIKRLAYARYSEGRAAHWLLLILGDRVDATGAHVRSLFSTRPDNPVTQTGVLSERRRHGIRSRFGRGRVDLTHAWMDPFIVAAPWVLTGVAVALGVRALIRRR